MNIVIACGGTGGHLFPGVAVGEVLLQRGHDVLLLVSQKEIDKKALESRRDSNFLVRQLPAMGWPRGLSLQTIVFGKQLLQAWAFCRRLYREFPPKVVLAMGGFTSAAPLWEAQRRGIPGVIHESNVIAGRANRLLARFAQKAVIGFKEAEKYFDPRKTVVGGTPLRREMRDKPDPAAVRRELGITSDLPGVLVMGGSQGAKGLNTKVLEALPFLKGTPVQFFHLCGRGDEARVEEAYRAAEIPARVWGFYADMQKLYAVSDLVIARSGASSITEINFFGLPAIYLPYPFAADRHQSANARVQVEAGAALSFEEDDISGEKLGREIRRLLGDASGRAGMAARSRKLAVDDAAERLADLLVELGSGTSAGN